MGRELLMPESRREKSGKGGRQLGLGLRESWKNLGVRRKYLQTLDPRAGTSGQQGY